MLEQAIEMKTQLESLVVSREEVGTSAIAGALQGLVSIIKETGEILPSAAFAALDINSRIVAYFLALRSAAVLGLSQKTTATAEEIAELVGLEPQRARENLSRLKRKFLLKTPEGWQLPIARIPAACDELKKKRR